MSELPLTDEQRDQIWQDLFRNILEFVFPVHLEFSRDAAARLYAWAEHGPAVLDTNDTRPPEPVLQTKKKKVLKTVLRTQPDGSLTLRGGISNGGRPLLAHELKLLLKEVAEQFVLDVYQHSGSRKLVSTVPKHEFEVLKGRCNFEVHDALHFTVPEVTDLCVTVRHVKPKSKGDKKAGPTPISWTPLPLAETPALSGPASVAALSPFSSQARMPSILSNMDKQSPTRASLSVTLNTDIVVFAPELVSEKTEKTEKPGIVAATDNASVTVPSRTCDYAKAEKERMFTLLSEAILRERERRIKSLQTASIKQEDVRRDDNVTKFNQTTLYNKTAIRPYVVNSYETPMDVNRSLHRSSCLVSLLQYGPAATADVVQNVKIIRHEKDVLPGEIREGWDPYCCIRQHGMSRKVQKL